MFAVPAAALPQPIERPLGTDSVSRVRRSCPSLRQLRLRRRLVDIENLDRRRRPSCDEVVDADDNLARGVSTAC